MLPFRGAQPRTSISITSDDQQKLLKKVPLSCYFQPNFRYFNSSEKRCFQKIHPKRCFDSRVVEIGPQLKN